MFIAQWNICFLFLTQLIDDYPSDAEVKELVDKFDWYLMPVVNPDGYSYTWSTVREKSPPGPRTKSQINSRFCLDSQLASTKLSRREICLMCDDKADG